mmetsp:Transcript_4280/g.12066  ORF Transcript_4280/g.12066 Transcript_4280/m.12066 type:complete len:224 (+) Transcript_4280:135-806(+)
MRFYSPFTTVVKAPAQLPRTSHMQRSIFRQCCHEDVKPARLVAGGPVRRLVPILEATIVPCRVIRCIVSVTANPQRHTFASTPSLRATRASCFSLPCQALPPSLAIAPATDPWVVWAVLASAGALGLWSEKTKIGHSLSGALVATLIGLLMSNVGVIPCDAPQYAVVNKMLLPLAIPMLLFSADLRRVFLDTGKLLGVFVVGSVATVLSTLAAFALLPLASLG